jgi:hypothetical protein
VVDICCSLEQILYDPEMCDAMMMRSTIHMTAVESSDDLDPVHSSMGVELDIIVIEV